jgi:hypothetical protein
MTNKTGGPAFPVLGGGFSKMLDGDAMVGMTLRDYFAAAALPQIMDTLYTIEEADDLQSELHDRIAEQAYLMADAMLAERDK